MNDRLAALVDERDIVALAIRYAWCLDTREWDGLRDVFTPGAFASLGGVDCNGIDAIIERVSSALGPLDGSQHMVNTHQVALEGDEATARCYFHAQHVKKSSTGTGLYVVAGIYHDRLVRVDDGWRIAFRVLEVQWREGDSAAFAR